MPGKIEINWGFKKKLLEMALGTQNLKEPLEKIAPVEMEKPVPPLGGKKMAEKTMLAWGALC